MANQELNGVLRELGSTASLSEYWNTLVARLAQKRKLDLLQPEQIRVLRWAQDRPLTNCELLKRTGWLHARASQNTGPLLKRKLLCERPGEKDKRRRTFHITPSGRETLTQLDCLAMEALREIRPGFTSPDIRPLYRSLCKANKLMEPLFGEQDQEPPVEETPAATDEQPPIPYQEQTSISVP